MLDVLIVGGGPAGLSAGLILGRCRRSVLICDANRPRNRRSRGVQGYLTRNGTPPGELRRIGAEELKAYPNIQALEAVVTDVGRNGSHFESVLEDGKRILSRKLLLAPGIEPDLPPIEGSRELYGRGLFDCPYCDGWELQDEPLAVYGRGARVKKFAAQLLGWSRDIVICSDGPPELSEEDLGELRLMGVEIKERGILGLEGDGALLRGIRFTDGEWLPRRAMFFVIGQPKPSPLLLKFGCTFDDHGSVSTGKDERTNVPGLYVAGDASRRVDFAIVAAAEGAMAAVSINRELLEQEATETIGPAARQE